MNEEPEPVHSHAPRQIYGNLRVELFEGRPENTMYIGGLSSDTTIRSFRAVVAARVGARPEHIRLMVYDEFLDDSRSINATVFRMAGLKDL
jgi:hypothetical protein